MAKIRKIYDQTVKPNGEKTVIYPITSTRAVYTPTSVSIDTILNEGYRFGGVVLPTDSPAITDQRVFYGASVPGVYPSFGGISVDGGEAIFLMWDGSSWHKGIFGGAGSNNLTGFKSLASISELPLEETMYGYLIDNYMYVWVGENGDTLDGKYQNVGQLRGASAYEVAVRNGYEGTEQQWLNDPVDGIKGNGIKSWSVQQSTEDSGVSIITVEFYEGNPETFTVKNGKGITGVTPVSISTQNGGVSTYRINYSDDTYFDIQVRNGKCSAGFFATASELTSAISSPSVGDYAFVSKAGDTSFPAYIYVCTTAGVWTATTEEFTPDDPTYIEDSLNSDSVTAALSAKQGKVLNENLTQLGQEVNEIIGAPSVELNLNQYTEQVGSFYNGVFRDTGGNFPNWRFVLIPVDDYVGRIMHIVPLSTTYGTQYVFLKDNVLINNVAANFATGYPWDVAYQPVDTTVPGDARYLWVRTQNVATETSYKPQSITVKEINGLLDEKVDKVAGKGLSTNDYTNADKSKLDSLAVGRYGVKWSLSDINDLGTRTLGAVGRSATIGIGNTDGASDFDSIYPWSGMKRCNIKTNENGASIVTFEGESGFALDGSNGDVFVRVPKFKTDHYIENGYEHIIIGDGYVHPAFIEDGVELDEIFIAAFEASGDATALYSKGGVIPANNYTGEQFLAAAKARGAKYSLYDMRCVDALWRLMAVEYGCRNSNRILGWGYANYMQPDNLSYLKVVVAAQNTNTVTLAQPTTNSWRVTLLQSFAAGNNLCICENTQANIIAERKITSVVCASTSDNVVITFEGTPIDVNTDMFVGNAPADCNYCETIGASWKLSWHTGRAARPVLGGIGYIDETCNPCRYRWIENPVGNVWHSLPDVTFKDQQMYVCPSMKDYEMLRYTSPYIPVGKTLPVQNSNGYKPDVNSASQPNYWITSLLLDIFAKGNNFAAAFDTIHDGTLTSQKGYGGYYYLYTGTHYIANGGGYDHLWRCNMLTNRAWQSDFTKWYLYGARIMYKNI